MNQSPTLEQLRELFRKHDESTGYAHILWVSRSGDVNISTLQGSIESPPLTNVRLRYEIFSPQSNQVGNAAATNDAFMNQMFNSLRERWTESSDADGETYVWKF